jgi:PKD repeat protein
MSVAGRRALASAFLSLLFLSQDICALSVSVPEPDFSTSEGMNTSPEAKGAGPRWEDNTTQVELLSQNLTVVLHPENRSISVDGQMSFRTNYNVSELYLWLYHSLDLTRLEREGLPVNYSRNPGSELMTVHFKPGLAKGLVLTFSCAYEGTMWVLEDGLRQDCVGWEGAYVKGSTHWYIMHHSSDWADYRLKICCPENWTAVADGELEAQERSAGWANYTWVTDRPCMRPAFAAGNYSISGKTVGGVNITAWTYPEDSAYAATYVDEAAKILSALSNILGPYERTSFKMVETDHQTMTGYACSGFVMLYPGSFGGTGVNYNLLSHETGHEWFPFATGYVGWAYPWLWEAFPEYLSCVYEKDIYGSWSRLDQDRNAFVQIIGDPRQKSIRATDWNDPLSYPVLYAKGAWVLHMLRGMLGDAAFFATLRDYVADNRYAMGSTELFIATSDRHSPIPLADFFQQWLNTTLVLDVSLSAARLYENGTGFFLELEPANLQCATNPADIGLEYVDTTGETIGLGWNGTAGLVRMPVRAAVTRVRLDPKGWLLDIDRSNEAMAPARPGNIYDLQVVSVGAPENLTDGQLTDIVAPVRNNSSYPVKAARVDFFMDGAALATRSLDIPQKDWLNASAAWPAVEGRHVISVRVDSDGKFHEWDETNNNGSLEIDVAPRPPRLDIWLGGLAVSPAGSMEGDTVTFCATVKNIGEAEVGGFSADFVLDGTVLLSQAVPGLDAGASRNLSAKWTAIRGMHNISATGDSQGAINETSETNNRDDASFIVGWPMRLTISAAPASPRTLEPVNFTVGGDSAEFSFDFGDGTYLCWTSERNATHQYHDDGKFTVTARGRTMGLEENTSISLTVQNRPPEVMAWADPASPMSLMPVAFSAKAVDRDGEIASIRWRFGDGSEAQGTRTEHSFSRPGNYSVLCTALDDDGNGGSASLSLNVQNRVPVIGWQCVLKADRGQNIIFDANSTDPDGCITLCRWDFGDGNKADGPAVRHGFARSGTYKIVLEVQDDMGGTANRSFQLQIVGPASKTVPSVQYLPLMAGMAGTLIIGLALMGWRRQKIGRDRQRDDFFVGNGQKP